MREDINYGTVTIGNEVHNLEMPKATYKAMRRNSFLGRDFMPQLLGHFYTEGELACRSVRGGVVQVGPHDNKRPYQKMY